MTDAQIINFLRDHADYFQQSSFIGDVLRTMGWSIIKGLKWLCDAAQTIFDTAFKLLDFTESAAFVKFWNEYKTITTPLLCLFIAFLGFKMIFNMDRKPTPIMKNLFILLMVSTSMLTIIPFMNDSVKALKRGVLGSTTVTQANEVINNGLYDLNYIDSTNKFKSFNVHYNSLSTSRIKNLDIVAKVTPDDEGISSKAEQLYSKKLEDSGTSQESYQLAEMKSSFLGMVDPPYYYRYKVDYFNIIVTLIALLLVFLFYAFNIVKLAIEVIMSGILGVILAPNIENNEKITKVINSIVNAFTTMAMIVLMIKIYTLLMTYVGQQKWNGLTEALMMLAISFAVIMGPDIVQRTLGYDMGIGNSMSQLYFAMKLGQAAMSPITNMVGAAGGKISETMKDKIDKMKDASPEENAQGQDEQASKEHEKLYTGDGGAENGSGSQSAQDSNAHGLDGNAENGTEMNEWSNLNQFEEGDQEVENEEGEFLADTTDGTEENDAGDSGFPKEEDLDSATIESEAEQDSGENALEEGRAMSDMEGANSFNDEAPITKENPMDGLLNDNQNENHFADSGNDLYDDHSGMDRQENSTAGADERTSFGHASDQQSKYGFEEESGETNTEWPKSEPSNSEMSANLSNDRTAQPKPMRGEKI